MQNIQRLRVAPLPDPMTRLRAEIDDIDDLLLELIERRFAAAKSIAALKATEETGHLKLRPRREQAVIERLTARVRNAPISLVEQVWRTIMAHSLQAQVRTEIVICSSGDPAKLLERVKARFGDAAPVSWTSNSTEALGAAQEREAVAVVDPEMVEEHQLSAMLLVFDAVRDIDGTLLGLAIGRVPARDAIELEAAR